MVEHPPNLNASCTPVNNLYELKTWAGTLVAKRTDCKSVTLETPMVRIHLCPLRYKKNNRYTQQFCKYRYTHETANLANLLDSCRFKSYLTFALSEW